MKKLIILLLSALLIFSLIGCGDNDEPQNENSILEGYEKSISMFYDDSWDVLFIKGDKDKPLECSYLVVSFKVDDSIISKLNEMNAGSDEFKNYISTLEILSSKDVTDKIPNEEIINSYIGLNFFEMEEKCIGVAANWIDSETGNSVFEIINDCYYLIMYMDGAINSDFPTDEELNALHVVDSEFAGFSYEVLDME